MDDQEIIELFWNRSEDAIFAASIKFGPYLRTVANNILHNSADAEECVNDTYLKAWNSIPPNRPRHLLAFLGRITRNLSLDRLKRLSTQKRGNGELEVLISELEEFSLSVSSPENEVEKSFVLTLINDYLFHQPELKRKIFLKRYWLMMGVREIAKEYGMTESKVNSMLFRMRSDLKKRLEKEEVFS